MNKRTPTPYPGETMKTYTPSPKVVANMKGGSLLRSLLPAGVLGGLSLALRGGTRKRRGKKSKPTRRLKNIK